MKTQNRGNFIVFLVFLAALGTGESLFAGKWMLEAETGAVLPGYNDVQVPNDAGTRFSIKDDLDLGNDLYFRLRLSWRLARRHALSVLYAPLTLRADGVLKDPVSFAGILYPEGAAVDALYRFNSSRLTYRYLLIDAPKLDFWIGFTAKIRDAEIALEGDGQSSNTTDVGFVPLLHLFLRWQWGEKTGLIFEADAAAAKQGRAEDVSAAFYYNVSPSWQFRAGYRLVEGGADVDQVYNFALINYLYIGIALSW